MGLDGHFVRPQISVHAAVLEALVLIPAPGGLSRWTKRRMVHDNHEGRVWFKHLGCVGEDGRDRIDILDGE